jgi:hypothetical protein
MKMNNILNRNRNKTAGHGTVKQKDKDKQKKKMKVSLRLPFLVVNNAPAPGLDLDNPTSPPNFKKMAPAAIVTIGTPATMQMTPTAQAGHPVVFPSASSYVDLDSSVDSTSIGDDACIPAEIDAQVQSMLSPFGPCLFNEHSEIGAGITSVFNTGTVTSTPINNTHHRNDNLSDAYSSNDGSDDETDAEVASIQSPYEKQAQSRIGIARQSYVSTQPTYSDVTPILNMRTTEQYSNASRNPQYQQDMAYQQGIQNTTKNYANSSMYAYANSGSLGIFAKSGGGGGQSSSPYENVTGANSGSLGIFAKSGGAGRRSSSPYENVTGDIHQPIIQQGPKVDTTDPSGLEYALDNDRFITPGHAFLKKERSLPRNFPPEKGHGLGIVPPPRKSRSSRFIVPHVTPPSNELYTIFILVIQPTAKMFELIRTNYHPATATVGDLIQKIPLQVTEEDLRLQNYIGLCRPHGRSSASRSLTKMGMTASVMARDGTCARILCGEVLVAIPLGYTGKETQILAQHIMRIPKMKRMLEKADPLSPTKAPISRSRSRGSRSSPVSSLGIQPMSKSANTTTGTFSSSVLFAPLSAAIHEEVDEKQQCNVTVPLTDMAVPRRPYNGADLKKDDDEPVKTSTLSVEPIVVEMLAKTTMDASTNTKSPEKFSRNPFKRTPQARPSTNVITPAPVAEEEGIQTSPSRSAPVPPMGLTAEQLELIKTEAVAAARIAAEEAFTMRMEELIEKLNVSSEQKASLLEDPPDDLSFHSAFSSWTVPPSPSTSLPGNINLNRNKVTPVKTAMGGLLSAFTRGISPMSPMKALPTSFSNTEGEAPSKAANVVTPVAMAQPQDRFVPIDTSSFDRETPIPIDPESDYSKSQDVMYGDELLEDFDVELIASTMEGFLASTIQAVSEFVDRKKENLRQLPDEVMKRKMALKAMSLACTIFLSSKLMNEHENGDLEALSTQSSVVDKPCTISDLQQILFWFMFMVQGQNYVTNYKSKRRRKSRSWKSRVKALR